MKKNILVIGESCRDVFIYCDVKRLAPDLPVPILNICNQFENAGMAKNVHRNILSIHSECAILTNSDWNNIIKTRYMHASSNHAFFRVDSPHDVNPLNLEEVCYEYDLIVISDYNKGFLTEGHIEEICSKHDLVFLDTKKVLGNWAKNASFIKINDYEYKNSEPFIDAHLVDKIIHTQGGDGCTFRGKRYRVKKADIKDTSGAGDSFMAALVVEYLRTENMEKSIRFANKRASEVVKQRGVGII